MNAARFVSRSVGSRTVFDFNAKTLGVAKAQRSAAEFSAPFAIFSLCVDSVSRGSSADCTRLGGSLALPIGASKSGLFPNAEPAEDAVEHVVGIDRADDLAQGIESDT